MTWIRGHWRYLLVGFLAFFVGVGAGGNSAKQNATVTNTVAGPIRYKTRPGRTIVKTRTVTTAAPAPKPATPPPAPAPAPAAMSFSGNGGKKIGTIKVARDSTFKWTNDGQLFQTFDDAEGIGVNSQGHSGSSDLPAGDYTGVDINADGNWTVRIVPK